MKQAVFSLKNYSVVNVMLDLENIPPQCIFDLKIERLFFWGHGRG